MIQRCFHYLRKHTVIEKARNRDTDPAIKRVSAGQLKQTQAAVQQLRKRELVDKSEKRPERKVDAKVPVKAVSKLSVSNSDINYQKYFSFNLENTPLKF